MNVYKHCLWCQNPDEAGEPHHDSCWVPTLRATIQEATG